jgi:hypothetical protein
LPYTGSYGTLQLDVRPLARSAAGTKS